MIPVHIKLLDAQLPMPCRMRNGDAGFDLCSRIDVQLAPGQRLPVPCGIAVSIPEGYAGLVMPRSGLAVHHGISIVNSPGLIDSNYRGEIAAVLVNMDPVESFTIQRGDRIAQLLIVEAPDVVLVPVDELDATDRGAQGFGSSGI